MIEHPKRQQNHNDDTNGGAYESGFAGALAVRPRPRMILHLSSVVSQRFAFQLP
jgi:hypothetical protein